MEIGMIKQKTTEKKPTTKRITNDDIQLEIQLLVILSLIQLAVLVFIGVSL